MQHYLNAADQPNGYEDALAGLPDIELRALMAATNEVPQVAKWVLAWIEGACDWEANRRAGRDYYLLPPEAAIDPSADAIRIDAVYAVRESYVASQMAPAVIKFFSTRLRRCSSAPESLEDRLR